MSHPISRRCAKGKNRAIPNGKPNFPEGNRISPVMQKVKGSLCRVKSAQELQFFTGQALSICQKLLSGHRVENREMIVALAQTHLVADLVLGLIAEDVKDPVARAMRKAAKKLKLQRELERLEAEDA
jgi:hypothetical protein